MALYLLVTANSKWSIFPILHYISKSFLMLKVFSKESRVIRSDVSTLMKTTSLSRDKLTRRGRLFELKCTAVLCQARVSWRRQTRASPSRPAPLCQPLGQPGLPEITRPRHTCIKLRWPAGPLGRPAMSLVVRCLFHRVPCSCPSTNFLVVLFVSFNQRDGDATQRDGGNQTAP